MRLSEIDPRTVQEAFQPAPSSVSHQEEPPFDGYEVLDEDLIVNILGMVTMGILLGYLLRRRKYHSLRAVTGERSS